MKTFDQVWEDICCKLKHGQEIETICRKVKNTIVNIEQDGITRNSERSRKGPMKIAKKDFEYVWNKIRDDGVYTLESIKDVRGRRAIICAILAQLEYVKAECEQGKVRLALKND